MVGPLALNGFKLALFPGLQPGLGKPMALRAENHGIMGRWNRFGFRANGPVFAQPRLKAWGGVPAD